jgi:hypothetical protein
MCVYVNGDDVVSSDDFRVSHFRMTTPMGHTMLLPQASCIEIARHPVTTYTVTDTWFMFNTGADLMIASRIITEDYGEVADFFKFDGVKYTLPKSVKSHIDAVSVLAEGEFDIEKLITVELDTGRVVISGARDIGEATAELKDKTFKPANPATFTINPEFFKEVLARTQDMKLGDDKGLFEVGNFRHLIGLTIK